MKVYNLPKGLVKAWTDGVPVEVEAYEQVANTASLPFIFKHIAVMPDVHFGMGATIGSVVPTKGAVIPAAVGVDIGCGMTAYQTGWKKSDLPQDLSVLREAIERAVPHGRTKNGGKNDKGAWSKIPKIVAERWNEDCDIETLAMLRKDYPELVRANDIVHLGTLGTGNHFIEVCLDKEDNVWVMLHSGSRGIGNRIGSHFIKLAKKEMERHFIELPDPNLAYFAEDTEHYEDYLAAVGWAQNFALQNRGVMLDLTLGAMEKVLRLELESEFLVDCHHNYVAMEKHFGEDILVTRKGATNAALGRIGIIPGSMGTKSYIVRGKGNEDSFNSCSHGAGRRMSRGAAKKTFSLEDHEAATAGVECKKDKSVLDETPGAYKDIDAVMAAQTDLVDIVYELKQVICVKG